MKLGEIIYENECPLSKKDKDRKINNITVRQNEISDNTLLFILSEKYLYDCIGTSRHPSVVVIDKNINIDDIWKEVLLYQFHDILLSIGIFPEF